jgi:type II secretory pathway component PulC
MQRDNQRQSAPIERSPLLQPQIIWAAILIMALALAAVVISRTIGADETTRRAVPPIVVNKGATETEAPAATAATSAPAWTTPEQQESGRKFIGKLNLQPRMRSGRIEGYIVRPEDPSILAGSLLQPGDVLLEADGVTLDAKAAASLEEDVGDYQDVYVRFERNSVEQEGVLTLIKR